jgi:hypothetical protein
METEPFHRSVVKNSDGVHPSSANELRQFLPARIAKEIRRQKNIALWNLARKIDRLAPKKASKLAGEFFAAHFRQRDRAFVTVERLSKIRRFAIPEAMIKVTKAIPAKRGNREALLKFGEEPASHPLHAGVASGPAGICYIDEQLHSAETFQQMN